MPYKKRKHKLAIVVHACVPSAQETRIELSWVWGHLGYEVSSRQLEPHCETLSYKRRRKYRQRCPNRGYTCELEGKDQDDASPKWSVPQIASKPPEARPQSITASSWKPSEWTKSWFRPLTSRTMRQFNYCCLSHQVFCDSCRRKPARRSDSLPA